MNKITRRDFLRLSSIGIASVVLVNLPACIGLSSQRELETDTLFTHGVASGDPLSDRVILWTRAVPESNSESSKSIITLQLATDIEFTENLIEKGELSSDKRSDFTIKIDLKGLQPDTTYYYRFLSKNSKSAIGTTRTLPINNVESVKLLVASCSYYSAGYFNVYKEMAKQTDINAVVHLGDYIYEYGPGIYADEEAEAMDRVMLPSKEILSLEDYRQRYAQTRLDKDCQAMHAAHPMIAIWDDHEVTNDTWSDGAENHSNDEGDFSERRLAALQAYVEWMPIRPMVNEDINSIQRTFQFGNLVNLALLDTRLSARDKQISYTDFTNSSTGAFDGKGFYTALNEPERKLIDASQFEFIEASFATPATWHVLGQQVLMGEMNLPAPIVTQQISTADYGKLAYKADKNPKSLSSTEIAILKSPSIPYNLDAWDGYPAAREQLLHAAKDAGVNLVVLAGDTHNAWQNELILDGKKVGVEFATSSVSSPGLEKYVNTTEEDEAGTVAAIKGLKYCNLVERGYMTVTFTNDAVESEWTFVDTVMSINYQVLFDRKHSVKLLKM